jgi:hypothetical protein
MPLVVAKDTEPQWFPASFCEASRVPVRASLAGFGHSDRRILGTLRWRVAEQEKKKAAASISPATA